MECPNIIVRQNTTIIVQQHNCTSTRTRVSRRAESTRTQNGPGLAQNGVVGGRCSRGRVSKDKRVQADTVTRPNWTYELELDVRHPSRPWPSGEQSGAVPRAQGPKRGVLQGSFVFFSILTSVARRPVGSCRTPLSPERFFDHCGPSGQGQAPWRPRHFP